jgi:uncharacterized membrane protein HdeD (DUF308 family)
MLPGKFTSRRLGAGFERLRDTWAGGAVRGMALIALGIVWLIDDVSATAAYVTVLTLGWLLLMGAGAVNGRSREAVKVPVESHTEERASIRRRF